MKHTSLIIALFLSSFIVQGQTTGEIIYEQTVDIHARMTGQRAQFKEMVPQYRTDQMILTFDDHQSVYIREQDEEKPVFDPNERGGRFRMRMMGAANGILWQDYKTDQRVEQRDFMDKKFLIKGEPHRYAWKMTGESKQVGQYLCQKATYSDSTIQLEAWFTPMIPVPLGPGEFGQLPGLVLHVDINNGQRTITATEINLKEIDGSTISEPTKGKEVTQEEFRSIVREKMKEMRDQNGGRGFGPPRRRN
ncbi:MAG: GLPGLI family protein [Saprospiraceae bacterium]|nr:GLPGLI family protein [Saprospiraceae bacterium]